MSHVFLQLHALHVPSYMNASFAFLIVENVVGKFYDKQNIKTQLQKNNKKEKKLKLTTNKQKRKAGMQGSVITFVLTASHKKGCRLLVSCFLSLFSKACFRKKNIMTLDLHFFRVA